MPLYAYSTDEEYYYGRYDTREAAADWAFSENPEITSCWVAEITDPIAPHLAVYGMAEDLIENVFEHEDYMGEWADWPSGTPEMRAELDESIRAAFKSWIEKHKLHPTHFCIDHAKEVTRP